MPKITVSKWLHGMHKLELWIDLQISSLLVQLYQVKLKKLDAEEGDDYISCKRWRSCGPSLMQLKQVATIHSAEHKYNSFSVKLLFKFFKDLIANLLLASSWKAISMFTQITPCHLMAQLVSWVENRQVCCYNIEVVR